MDIDSPRPSSPPVVEQRSQSPQQQPQAGTPAAAVKTDSSPPPPQSQSQPQSQDTAPPQSQSTYVSSSQPSTLDESQPKRSPSVAPADASSEPTPAQQHAGDTDPDAMKTDDDPAPLTNGHASGHAPMPNGTHPRDDHEHDTSSSSGVSAAPSVCVATDAPAEEDDMDRFLKRMDMEKKIAQLQQRLELASFKTNHGWSDMSINEIETRLPTAPQSRPQVVISGGRGVAYEPPSPNRPWQLADSLWQNLPQPGRNGGRPHPPVPSAHNFHRPPPHSMHAPSHSLPGGLPSVTSLQMHGGPRGPPPASPRRHRMDEYLSSRPAQTPSRKHAANGHSNGRSGGHRRASSSISGLQFLGNDPYPASPARAKKATKKRSQSHSNLRDRPTTQDVDAARALTSMFEAGRSPKSSTHERLPSLMEPPSTNAGPRLPPLNTTASFPPPFSSSDMPPPRPRAQSFVSDARDSKDNTSRPTLPPIAPPGLRTPSSHARGRGQSMDSSAAFRGGFWQASSSKPGASPAAREREQREREQRERDRQRERERDRSERYEEGARGEDDQTAAELMMFLAHSPSPVRKRAASDFPPPSFGGTARVLFADSDRDRERERERERMREPAPGPRPGPPSLPAPPRLQDQPMRG